MDKSLVDMTPKEIGAALIALDGTNSGIIIDQGRASDEEINDFIAELDKLCVMMGIKIKVQVNKKGTP